jgi:hypothetical protein
MSVGLIVGALMSLLSLWALRSEDVGWPYALPFASIPLLTGTFLGFYGMLVGVLYAASMWKLDLTALR